MFQQLSSICFDKGSTIPSTCRVFKILLNVWWFAYCTVHVSYLQTLRFSLIADSALESILEKCSLATIGAGAVVDVKHIKRARYCTQVTVNSLYLKLVDAVKEDKSELSLIIWLQEKASSNYMCYYLFVLMILQMEILIFIWSMGEGDFVLHVECLRNLLKWFFALDHFNCARWLIVHVFDLIYLPISCPHFYE